MNSLYIWLSTILLSVSVRGFMFSVNGWTLSVADAVSAEEGRSAVLPFSFTHPHPGHTVTGSVIWYKGDFFTRRVIFNCTHSGLDHSRAGLCESVGQQDGENRFRFVGNLSNSDASIMMERLSQADSDEYRCRLELNIGSVQPPWSMGVWPRLRVRAAGGNGSVVSGTEGASVTLPCMFTRPTDDTALSTVTWMRKEPYQHVVTFRAQSNGSWTTANGGNRFELVGNPKEGNASIRINQLRVTDNNIYLCLMEYKKWQDYQHLVQNETRLQVLHVAEAFPIAILCIPLGVKLLALFVLCIMLFRDRTRKEQD